MIRFDLKLDRRDYLISLLIFTISLLLHIIRLNYWSPLPDEINYARCARYLIDNKTFINKDIMFFPPLFVYLSAILQILGAELLTSVRLISAVAGALVLSILFFMARLFSFFPKALLLITAIFPMFSFHLYSRLGQVEILMLFFIILSIFFLFLALSIDKKIYIFYAGLSLGIGVWVKETTLGTVAVIIIFILIFAQKRRQLLANFLLGFLPPMLLLILLGIFSGQNLLFEIMAARGYDVNMLKLDPIGNFFALAAIFCYNIIPRLFYPWEFLIFIFLAPTISIFLLVTIIKGFRNKNLLVKFVNIYLLLHLPFFFFFSRKFDYYLLPSVLLTLFATGLILFATRISQIFRLIGIILFILFSLFNIYSGYFLYFNRGTHKLFEITIRQLKQNTTIATSHPTLVEYITSKNRLNLRVIPLFQGDSYRINSKIWSDTTIETILTKYYYYERLGRLFPNDWQRLNIIFLKRKDVIDRDWSLNLPLGNLIFKKIADFAKPTGILILTRR